MTIKSVLVALSLLASSGCSAGKARVAFASPMGLSTSPIVSVSVMFDREIVTDLELGEEVTNGPFKITPALEGSFRWEQPDEVVFTPKLAVAERQAHRITLDTAVLAQDGSPLDDYGWSFAWNSLSVPVDNPDAEGQDLAGQDLGTTDDGGIDDVCP